MARRDPRLDAIPRSVNDDIQDRAIRHLLFILRLSTQETNQVLEFLDRDVLPDVLTLLQRRLVRISERGFDLGPVTTRRLQELPTPMSPAEMRELFNLLQGGGIAWKDYVRKLKEGEVIAHDRDAEDIKAEIETDGIAVPGLRLVDEDI